MAKIICPFHADSVPSMEVYSDGYGFCFVCSARALIGESNVKPIKKNPDDLKSTISYIHGLPLSRVRGLDLPQDSLGYYILWPSNLFYKRRNTSGLARYTGPKGIKPPIFMYPGGGEHLVVIEGELNCMSVFEVVKNTAVAYTLCSPGAATQFPKFIDLYKQFKRVTLILDRDAVGVVYGSQTKEAILKYCKRVNLVVVDPDYNDLLQQSHETLLTQFRKDVL